MKALVLALGLMTSVTAHAGGWVSGGGELIRDGRNPWFLQNTRDVSYCVEIDEANFGQSRARIEQLVARVFEAWKFEFQQTIPGSSTTQSIEVATQKFHRTSCSPSTDIRFQFGVLSGGQIRRIGDPKKFLGLTVRTDYDRVQMRGKGFVYISRASGPFKYESDDVRERPWEAGDGALLYALLLHEVGHVFGVTHSAEAFSLMDERFPELILKPATSWAAEFYKDLPEPQIF